MREFFDLLISKYGERTSISFDPITDRIEVRCAGDFDIMDNVYQTAFKANRLVGLSILLR